MPKHAIEVVDWKPYERNTLRGFATINVRELHLSIKDVVFHQKNDSQWVQLPSRPLVIDGALIHGSDGRVRYVPILEFSDRETASAFSAACWQALETYRQT